MEGRKIIGTLAEVAVALSALIQVTSAATYIVGDNAGWTTPYGANTYDTWAAQHTFYVGDNLVFNFVTGVHTAALVDQNTYSSCNTNNPIDLRTNGPATFTLRTPGMNYFICTIHCLQGQKFGINVLSSGYYFTPPGMYYAPPQTYYYDSIAHTKVVPSSVIFLSIALTCFLY